MLLSYSSLSHKLYFTDNQCQKGNSNEVEIKEQDLAFLIRKFQLEGTFNKYGFEVNSNFKNKYIFEIIKSKIYFENKDKVIGDLVPEGRYALILFPNLNQIRMVKRNGRDYIDKYFISVSDPLAEGFKKQVNKKGIMYKSHEKYDFWFSFLNIFKKDIFKAQEQYLNNIFEGGENVPNNK